MTDFINVGALVLGLVQVAKSAGMNSRWAPLLAVALGTILGGLIIGLSVEACLTGLVAALSVMGLYSGAKKTAKIK